MHFSNRLRALRGHRFTQEELAERLGVGPSTYRGWEEGRHRPHPRNVRALCEEFGVEEVQLGYDQADTRRVLRLPPQRTLVHHGGVAVTSFVMLHSGTRSPAAARSAPARRCGCG